MSLREEDKQKTSCPSRGLGLAAAAMGVGVGAALYCIFTKEQAPDNEGSTSAQWTTESPQTFHEDLNSSNDYTTVSENTTTDTSMHDSYTTSSDDEDNMTEDSDSSSPSSPSSSDDTLSSSDSDSNNESDWSTDELDENEWDVDPSLELPHYDPPRSSPIFNWFSTLVSPRSERKAPGRNVKNARRSQVFRERTWSLEECSICFEVILKNQEVMTLSCTHNFHQSCILPWLQERQTCPNCRKAVH